MDKETLLEVKEVVEHATNGNWMPFGIVCVCFGLIVVLFIYILKMKEKENNSKHDTNNERHNATNTILEKLTENNTAMNTMIAVHEVEIDNLKNTA